MSRRGINRISLVFCKDVMGGRWALIFANFLRPQPLSGTYVARILSSNYLPFLRSVCRYDIELYLLRIGKQNCFCGEKKCDAKFKTIKFSHRFKICDKKTNVFLNLEKNF